MESCTVKPCCYISHHKVSDHLHSYTKIMHLKIKVIQCCKKVCLEVWLMERFIVYLNIPPPLTYYLLNKVKLLPLSPSCKKVEFIAELYWIALHFTAVPYKKLSECMCPVFIFITLLYSSLHIRYCWKNPMKTSVLIMKGFRIQNKSIGYC